MRLPELKELVEWRNRLGLTQRKVAAGVGIKQPYLAKIETGQANPGYGLISRLVGFYNEEEEKVERVSTCCNPHIVSVSPRDKVHVARLKMLRGGFDQLPVFSGPLNSGSITIQGIMEAYDRYGKEKAREMPVSKVMGDSFPEVPSSMTVEAARSLLKGSQLLLVKKEGKVVGVVTGSDLV